MNEPIQMKKILDRYSPMTNIKNNGGSTTNVNVNNNITNNVYVSKKDELINQLIEECGGEIKYAAKVVAEKLNDLKSLNYYIKVAKEMSIPILFESMSETIEAERKNKIRKNMGTYFVGIIKNKKELLNKKGE